MFKKVDYYNSADEMPIGRYMLATCKDIRYYAKGDLPEKINTKKLKKALQQFNKTLIKDSGQKQILKDIKQLGKDEAGLYMQSALVALIAYCNELNEIGIESDVITDKLKPIQGLLIERGLTPDSKRNANRLEKYARNFRIKSENIQNKLKNDDVNREKVYEYYLRNLVTIERVFGVKIDEHTYTVNKYILLIDELKKHGNRPK